MSTPSAQPGPNQAALAPTFSAGLALAKPAVKCAVTSLGSASLVAYLARSHSAGPEEQESQTCHLLHEDFRDHSSSDNLSAYLCWRPAVCHVDCCRGGPQQWLHTAFFSNLFGQRPGSDEPSASVLAEWNKYSSDSAGELAAPMHAPPCDASGGPPHMHASWALSPASWDRCAGPSASDTLVSKMEEGSASAQSFLATSFTASAPACRASARASAPASRSGRLQHAHACHASQFQHAVNASGNCRHLARLSVPGARGCRACAARRPRCPPQIHFTWFLALLAAGRGV